MVTKRHLLFTLVFSVAIALGGNTFAAIVFTYTSTPDDASMSMPADQGWTQVATDITTWNAGDEAVYANVVSPSPGFVAHDEVENGERTYIYQALTAQQEADALANGWELTMRARFYQTWNTGFSPDGPDHELGFGIKTSAGDAIVAHKLQRDFQASPNVYASFVALYGSDEENNLIKVESPRIYEPGVLHPTYADYTFSYNPVSDMMTLTVTNVQDGFTETCTLTNNLAPSTGLWDGVEVAEGEEENILPAALYIGSPASAVNSGHIYIDYLSFEINGPPPAPGDTDNNGKVDAADAATLADNWLYGVGMETPDATWAMGDFNGDGMVNDIDATLLASNWQTGSPSAAVPEPGMFALLLAAIGSLFMWRRVG